eukprot:m.52961 g.52961  ORF g.52961 m.52961 type:complete len:103 (+) comp9135_c0_seq1:3259-3567(+)
MSADEDIDRDVFNGRVPIAFVLVVGEHPERRPSDTYEPYFVSSQRQPLADCPPFLRGSLWCRYFLPCHRADAIHAALIVVRGELIKVVSASRPANRLPPLVR